MKPENILLESASDKKLDVKIADFGFSCIFDPREGLDLVLGSPLYMAPEIIKGETYNEKVDIWSMGVITYMLLTGRNPYPGKNKDQVKRMIVHSEVDLVKHFKGVSEDAKDFIRMALNKDIEGRYSAKQLLDHKWLKNLEDKISHQVEDGDRKDVL